MWDKALRVRDLPADFFWTIVALLPNEIEPVAEFIEMVVEHHKHRPIPFSFIYKEDSFDVTGRIRGGSGMTCATFILAIFERFQMPLVDVKTWRKRPVEDRKFQDAVIEGASQNQFIDSGTISNLLDEKPNFRIKPAEVCGAAAHGKYPVNFNLARKLADEVYQIIRDVLATKSIPSGGSDTPSAG